VNSALALFKKSSILIGTNFFDLPSYNLNRDTDSLSHVQSQVP